MRDILYEALASEFGLIIECDQPLSLRGKLYAERRADPALSVLSFVLSPDNPDSELWIVKRKEPDYAET